MRIGLRRILIVIVAMCLIRGTAWGAPPVAPPTSQPMKYAFDETISEPTLRAYLSRAVTAMYLIMGQGNLQDNIRMLESIGAKFCGRTIFLWGGEESLPKNLAAA